MNFSKKLIKEENKDQYFLEEKKKETKKTWKKPN